ncbi:alpha/beta hydrolase family protein [Cellulomonas sp. NS3]|uniref:alpha/beta hydrolase family protein n=1 Tax=Cellulomonas sp. NS3 TaxID=2973977 RepID=UPI002162E8A0|nr:acyl-CoA thioester hydrolase/BAAT C-terminal domain-containing protein [Cellulomonas sp. NS3]
MPNRVAAGTVVGIILLAVLGAVMGPQWDPVPLTDPLEVQSRSTAIGAAPEPARYEVRTTVVSVQLDGAVVQAQISEPVGAPGERAGVVFVHGAGTGKFSTAFEEQAYALAESGVVAMVPDKRLDTYTARHRDYVAMAADYARSVEVLRGWADVDPARVGLYGESEGAWIAPVMAAQDPSLAFVALVSAPVVPPRQQAAFATDSYLRNTGVPSGVFRAIPRAVGMSLPGGGFEYADFDVAPYQRQMRQPVLVVYGTGDASMPLVQGAEQIIRDTAIAGSADYTVRYYEGASHGIRVGGVVVEEFLRDLTGWVRGLPETSGASPRIAGAQPVQDYWAAPVPTPRWLGDGDVVLATVGGGVALLAVGPFAHLGTVLTRTVRRRRGQPERPDGLGAGIRGRADALRLLVVATVAALVWYLVAVARLALGYERNAWVVQGGWIGVRVLGIAAVVAGVALLDRGRRLREAGDRVATGRVAVVELWTSVVGAAVILVVLAYWGVYQLGI